jgi:CxxC motif-containing protein
MEETSKNVVKLIRCIVCPTGCSIKVIGKDENNVEFEGYHCKRGLEYAEQEFREPKRILTTTMKVDNGTLPLIPVRTDKPLLKEKLKDVLKIIAQKQTKAPIKMGDVLIEDILEMGINIIASRNLEKKSA